LNGLVEQEFILKSNHIFYSKKIKKIRGRLSTLKKKWIESLKDLISAFGNVK
jgi:hypothetical protein